MALKIAINGFGRIGRSVARIIANRDDVELVAINDTASNDVIQYLIQYDSVHGTQSNVSIKDGYLLINNTKAKIFHEKNPADLDFGSCGADVVLECTGLFLTTEAVKSHLDKGVKKVIISAPASDDTPTFVLGVNSDKYSGENIISNASCTTNCLGPVAKILDEHFGIQKGLMTTIHSYTNDQNTLDGNHNRDIRRTRAAGVNMIPTSTGAAKALKLVLPQLDGKLHGQSVRVPTPNVSMVDLNVLVGKNTTPQEINKLFIEASQNSLAGILDVDESMKVSQDIQGDSHSSIVATDLTQVVDGNMVKVMAWYDNEWGYSNRLIDMAKFITQYN